MKEQKPRRSGTPAPKADNAAILRAPRGAGVRNGSLLAETAVAAMLETGTLVSPFGGLTMTAHDINLAIDREGLIHERIATLRDDEALYLLVFYDNSCLLGRRVVEKKTPGADTRADTRADWAAEDVIQIDPNALCIARTLSVSADGFAEPTRVDIAVRSIRRRFGSYLRLGATIKETDGALWSAIDQPFGSDLVARIKVMLHDAMAARASAIRALPVLCKRAGAAALNEGGLASADTPTGPETPTALWPAYMTRRPGTFGAAWPAVQHSGETMSAGAIPASTMSASNALDAGILLRAIIQARVGSSLPDAAAATGQSVLEPSAISEIRLVCGTGPHTIQGLCRPGGFIDIKAPGANPGAIRALRAAIEDDLSGWLDLSRLQGWDYARCWAMTKAQRRLQRSLELHSIVSLDRIAAIVADASNHERIAIMRAIRQAKAARAQSRQS